MQGWHTAQGNAGVAHSTGLMQGWHTAQGNAGITQYGVNAGMAHSTGLIMRWQECYTMPHVCNAASVTSLSRQTIKTLIIDIPLGHRQPDGRKVNLSQCMVQVFLDVSLCRGFMVLKQIVSSIIPPSPPPPPSPNPFPPPPIPFLKPLGYCCRFFLANFYFYRT